MYPPPNKLERLLFRHMSYALSAIHGHICAYLNIHQPPTIAELAKGIAWDEATVRKACNILSDYKLVIVSSVRSQGHGGHRMEPHLTDLGRAIVLKSKEITSPTLCPAPTPPTTCAITVSDASRRETATSAAILADPPAASPTAPAAAKPAAKKPRRAIGPKLYSRAETE